MKIGSTVAQPRSEAWKFPLRPSAFRQARGSKHLLRPAFTAWSYSQITRQATRSATAPFPSATSCATSKP
jgi:hypothetical protein